MSRRQAADRRCCRSACSGQQKRAAVRLDRRAHATAVPQRRAPRWRSKCAEQHEHRMPLHGTRQIVHRMLRRILDARMLPVSFAEFGRRTDPPAQSCGLSRELPAEPEGPKPPAAAADPAKLLPAANEPPPARAAVGGVRTVARPDAELAGCAADAELVPQPSTSAGANALYSRPVRPRSSKARLEQRRKEESQGGEAGLSYREGAVWRASESSDHAPNGSGKASTSLPT